MRVAVVVALVAVRIAWPASVPQEPPAPAPAAATPASAATGLTVDVRSRAVRPGEVLAIDVRGARGR